MDTPAAPADSPATHTHRQEQLVRWTLQPLLQTVQLHTQTGAAGQMDTPAAPAHSPATHTQTGTAGQMDTPAAPVQSSYTHRQEQLVRWTLQPLLQTVQLHIQTGAAGQMDTPAAPADSPATHTDRSSWSDGLSSRFCRQSSYTHTERSSWSDGHSASPVVSPAGGYTHKNDRKRKASHPSSSPSGFTSRYLNTFQPPQTRRRFT